MRLCSATFERRLKTGITSVLLFFVAFALSVDAGEASKKPAQTGDASDEFFQKGMIPELRIEISEPELEKLKAEPRTYVKATIHENGQSKYSHVALKLKGAAGSFREFDDRPALTINVAKHDKGQTFHGLHKFHLNNSVQDETYLQEWLCEELFRAAKIPATRVTHARVWLNDRDVGLYVLKAGFDKTFLERHFKDADGNLYDGGFVQDIDAELEKDSGKGPDDRSDLVALLESCREPDPEARWKRVDKLLNVDQFLTFMAMEMMTGHWDGYTLNHNNYRLYIDPSSHQAFFLPHGMDQMFGDPGASILDFPESIVGATVMQNREWRTRYRKRIGELLPLFTPPDKLLKRIAIANKRLRPILKKMDPQLAREHDDRVKEFQERLVARIEDLLRQNLQPDPQPREFDENGRLALSDWYAASESEDAVLEEAELPKGKKTYSILCGASGQCIASWRTKDILGKGTYLFHANVRTENSASIEDEKGSGAGIRISGANRTNKLEGSSEWSSLEFEFEIEEDIRNVEFVIELRATKGQVWFETDTLHLTRK